MLELELLQLRGPWAQHSAGRCSSSDVGRAALQKAATDNSCGKHVAAISRGARFDAGFVATVVDLPRPLLQ